MLAADVGRKNFCIDTSLQAYKDTGSGAEPVGAPGDAVEAPGRRAPQASQNLARGPTS